MKVRTEKYIFNRGKNPRGYGRWAFAIEEEVVFITGFFAEAKKQALIAAKKQHVFEIEVLP